MKERAKSIFSGIGLGGLFAGGMVINILHIIVVWGTGLTVVAAGIDALFHGSVILGLVVIFLGTPIAVALSELLFPLYLILLAILLLILLVRWLLGI